MINFKTTNNTEPDVRYILCIKSLCIKSQYIFIIVTIFLIMKSRSNFDIEIVSLRNEDRESDFPAMKARVEFTGSRSIGCERRVSIWRTATAGRGIVIKLFSSGESSWTTAVRGRAATCLNLRERRSHSASRPPRRR